jgi:hypothetical protein
MEKIFTEQDNEMINQINPDQLILDLSTYPFLEKIITKSAQNNQQIYCIPDTLPLLLIKAKGNPQYYSYITKLFLKWTKREIDIQYFSEIFHDSSRLPNNIKLIGKDDVDPEIYNYCYQNIVIKELTVEFSPKFNIIGDLIGKMLGYAKKTKTPILMFNQRLVKIAKSFPVLLNNSLKLKQEFLVKRLPHLEYGQGIRFYIGFILEIGNSFISIPLAREAGYILIILDP